MSTSRPRIAFIGLNYQPESTGIAPYTTAMTRGLARRQHAVRAIAAHPHYPKWRVRDGYGQWSRDEWVDGVHLHRVWHYVPRVPRGVARLMSEMTFGLRSILTRWGKPDLLVTVSPGLFSSAFVMARARLQPRRTPVIVWVQDLYALGLSETGQASSTTLSLMRAVEGWLLRSADRVIVIHDRFATRVHEDFRVPRARIEVIRNWTHLRPTPAVDAASARSRFGWNDAETIVLHAGNMGVKQGLSNVVEAARLADGSNAPLRFVLLGDGSDRDRLEASAAGIRSIQFIPPLDDDGFAQALAVADVLLVNELPGVSEMAVPSKLTSYFSAGRPVLAATDPAGITADEIRAARAGVVVPSGDPGALLDAAIALSTNHAGAQDFGTAGRRYRETMLDEEHAIDRFVAVVDNVRRSVARKG